MTKTNSKGYSIGTPICFGVGGPIVREPVSVLAGTPRVGGPRVLELCSCCIGYGINPIPYMLCQGLINIYSMQPPKLSRLYQTRFYNLAGLNHNKLCIYIYY